MHSNLTCFLLMD